jgi:hypothetical protein
MKKKYGTKGSYSFFILQGFEVCCIGHGVVCDRILLKDH